MTTTTTTERVRTALAGLTDQELAHAVAALPDPQVAELRRLTGRALPVAARTWSGDPAPMGGFTGNRPGSGWAADRWWETEDDPIDDDGYEAHARSLGFTPDEYTALSEAGHYPGDVSDMIAATGYPGDDAAEVLLRFRDPDPDPATDPLADTPANHSAILSDFAGELEALADQPDHHPGLLRDLADRLDDLARRIAG